MLTKIKIKLHSNWIMKANWIRFYWADKVTKKQTQIQGTYSFFVYPNDLMLININIMGSEYKIMHRQIKKFKIVNWSGFCNIIEDFSNLNKLYKRDDHKGAKGRNFVLRSFWKTICSYIMVQLHGQNI